MPRWRRLRDCESQRLSKGANRIPLALAALRDEQGASIVEFAVVLPLLVVFVVGIYDFSNAFSQKQKIDQATQEGAILAGAQPTNDTQATNADPLSLHPVVFAIFNSLAASGVLPNAGGSGTTCVPPGAVSAPVPPALPALTWTYTISGCPDTLTIIINRGWTSGAGNGVMVSVGTTVTVQYPYHWLGFYSVIQTLIPGAKYASTTTLTETATVHNQM